MIPISSQENQWLKRLRALAKRKYRIACEQFVAEGRRFVEVLGEERGEQWRLFEEKTLVSGQPADLGD